MSGEREQGGFLDRWSKRKQAVEAEQVEVAEEAVGPEVAEPETEEQALEVLRERDAELADQVEAIDIDSMTYDDDFSVFMNKKVPEFLRRKALSKLWLSSPVLANLDGLNEYDENFRDAGSIVEAVQTAFSKDEASDGKPALADGPGGSDQAQPATAVPEDEIAELEEEAEAEGTSEDLT